MLWLVLTVTWHAHAVGIKERVSTPVSKSLMLNVLSAVVFPLSNVCNSMPSYKLKKDKREAKKLESTPSKDTESLVDPSVAVLWAVDKQGTVKSPPTVAPPPPPPPEKKAKKKEKA